MAFTEVEKWLYLAGIIDGEGCIRIMKQRGRKSYHYFLHIEVGNTSEKLISFIKTNFGGCSYKSKRVIPFKPFYRWYVACKQAEIILQRIAPYLIVKKEEAMLGLDFCRKKKEDKCNVHSPLTEILLEERENYRLVMKELKHVYR